MSKTALKKHLQTLTKEQLQSEILELYSNYKPVKDYLEYKLNPNPKEKLEYYKNIIREEFYPKRKTADAKMRFVVAKKAISEFRKLGPSTEQMADLLLTLPEYACKFTHEFGDMWEQYYDSASTNFKLALEFISAHNLLEKFKERCEQCRKYASDCGWGFSDDIDDLYYEYYT